MLPVLLLGLILNGPQATSARDKAVLAAGLQVGNYHFSFTDCVVQEGLLQMSASAHDLMSTEAAIHYGAGVEGNPLVQTFYGRVASQAAQNALVALVTCKVAQKGGPRWLVGFLRWGAPVVHSLAAASNWRYAYKGWKRGRNQ